MLSSAAHSSGSIRPARPCHGVGRGQTIRRGKLGNAIGMQGGKGGRGSDHTGGKVSGDLDNSGWKDD